MVEIFTWIIIGLAIGMAIFFVLLMMFNPFFWLILLAITIFSAIITVLKGE